MDFLQGMSDVGALIKARLRFFPNTIWCETFQCLHFWPLYIPMYGQTGVRLYFLSLMLKCDISHSKSQNWFCSVFCFSLILLQSYSVSKYIRYRPLIWGLRSRDLAQLFAVVSCTLKPIEAWYDTILSKSLLWWVCPYLGNDAESIVFRGWYKVRYSNSTTGLKNLLKSNGAAGRWGDRVCARSVVPEPI